MPTCGSWGQPDRSENVRYLFGGGCTHRRAASLAAQIFRINGIAARAVHGLDLAKTGSFVDLAIWLEVHNGDHRQPFTIVPPEPRLPALVAWCRGDEPFVKIEGSKVDRCRISVARVDRTMLREALLVGRRPGANIQIVNREPALRPDSKRSTAVKPGSHRRPGASLLRRKDSELTRPRVLPHPHE